MRLTNVKKLALLCVLKNLGGVCVNYCYFLMVQYLL